MGLRKFFAGTATDTGQSTGTARPWWVHVVLPKHTPDPGAAVSRACQAPYPQLRQHQDVALGNPCGAGIFPHLLWQQFTEPLVGTLRGKKKSGSVIRAGWQRNRPSVVGSEVLLAGWSDRMERGVFRYRLGPLPTRVLPGSVRLVAQLNEQRSADAARRSPSVAFGTPSTRAPSTSPGCAPQSCCSPAPPGGPGPPPDPLLVAINASPLERGHVLLLPEPARRLPQALTAPGCRALEARVLHHPLPLEGPGRAAGAAPGAAPRRPAPAFLSSPPARGAGAGVAGRVPAAEHLDGAGRLQRAGGPRLRVLLWARPPIFGPKAGEPFAVALCELAGLLPLPTELLYRDITEMQALSAIRQHLLPEPELLHLGGELARLLERTDGTGRGWAAAKLTAPHRRRCLRAARQGPL
uniref:GDPGP1-like N-terminal domain-containing protein n=1 Tax=Malurus cyaneus samueli TaxID=2593467 RepID=A0A8C5U072_9PASS